jgi:hypothetical protein
MDDIQLIWLFAHSTIWYLAICFATDPDFLRRR